MSPGKAAFPFHSHRANEELFLVLEGQGELRFGSETFPVKPGDVVACPPGGAEHAHQFVNTAFPHIGREQQDLDYWDGE